jgi:hypothetical protein
VLPLEADSSGTATTPPIAGHAATVDPAEPLTFSARPLSNAEPQSSSPGLPGSADGHSDTHPPLTGSSFAEANCVPVTTRPISVREDLHRLFPDLWDDTKSIVNVGDGLMIGGGLALALGLRQDADGDVRHYVAENPTRWGDATRTLRVFGEPGAQVPAMFAIYGYSVWTQDEDLHDFSRAMLHAHGLTSLSVVAVKGIANTRRPTDEFLDGKWGFPSFHTAGVFAIGATVEEYYGWQPAIPIYVLGGLVGWSRIDQQEHDLSDVVFGSVLGYVIGHAVAARHLQRNNGWEIRPWYDPVQKASGVRLEVPF